MSSLDALVGTNFNPVPGSLDVIKQPALIHCQFFRKQGILVDEGDGNGIDGDVMMMVILVIVLVVRRMMTVVVLSIQLSHTMGSFKSD